MFKKDIKTHKKLFPILGVVALVILTACNSTYISKAGKKVGIDYDAVGSAVAVDFGPDRRLWRLIPTADFVYVDYSDDQGLSFSAPVKVNHREQEISAWAENPPVIEVDKTGRIHVIYFADETQKSTTFYSVSDDGGRTFSAPVLVSDEAENAKHYMDKMLVDAQGKVYLFWHDTRHGNHQHGLGSGVLSLYYTTLDKNDKTFVNRKLKDSVCSCCRTATDLAPDGKPVVLARMVFEQGVRDHALFKMMREDQWSEPRRIAEDQWQVDACPEHGPALSIDRQGRSHLSWFTLGAKRKGIYYANTDDYGNTLSKPLALGNKQKLPSHPDVLALGERVVLAWKEFDGSDSTIVVKQSNDRGENWSADSLVLSAPGKVGYPDLIASDNAIFLSWSTQEQGHQFIEITQ